MDEGHVYREVFTDMPYDQPRLALDALGVRARVWRPDHPYRFKVEASIPLGGVTRINTSRFADRNLLAVLKWAA